MPEAISTKLTVLPAKMPRAAGAMTTPAIFATMATPAVRSSVPPAQPIVVRILGDSVCKSLTGYNDSGALREERCATFGWATIGSPCRVSHTTELATV